MPNARLDRICNIHEMRLAAKRSLPLPLFDFMDGGAEDERTLHRNTAAFDRWALLPSTGVDVSAIDTRTTVLGEPIGWPVVLAPTGITRMFHTEGERAVAPAAARADTIYTLSTMSSVSIEEIAGLTKGPKWFQVYCFKDRELTREFLQRAKSAGYKAICITVDVQVAANRERDKRSGITIPVRLTVASALQFAMRPLWCRAYFTSERPILANVIHKIKEGSVDLSTVSAYINRQFDPSITWKDLEWMAGEWGGPVMIKGILSPDDAKRAKSIGARAVIISNHGGRQLDGAAAAMDALPRIADAVGNDLELILDGGIRRGTHVLKALALGAKTCMIGRPYLFGLAAAGEAGVDRALKLLKDEVTRDMALLGARNVGEIRRDMVVPVP
jgi:L-lactate dehydrogenase (cytochrome)